MIFYIYVTKFNFWIIKLIRFYFSSLRFENNKLLSITKIKFYLISLDNEMRKSKLFNAIVATVIYYMEQTSFPFLPTNKRQK